jgi:tetratricopeptide (TPR) repeat protein
VVYEAVQQQPRRDVAIKVLRGGSISDPFQTRLFERETQTLARLSHPGIAAIYEAGQTDDERHFYAMELVRGRTLVDYADLAGGDGAPALGTRERLRLFRGVCDAISYAHQRGVIHRDIKPGNIIVDEAGRPKVLDFGLARLMESEAVAPVVTQPGVVMGTFAYMSPEQALGRPDEVDTRSDVYGLGAVLYELLTGSLPHDVRGMTMAQAVRHVTSEPPKPPRRVRPNLPLELEAIILKAMEADPERRYPSVDALAEDVDRYLSGHPVLARRPGALYKFRKLIGRHKTASSLIALLALSIISSAVVATWQAARIADERTRVQREVVKFAQINAALRRLFESPDPWREGQHDITVMEVLDRAARQYEVDLADAPLVAAAVNMTLGQTYANLGNYDAAERLVRSAYETRKRELGPGDLEVAASASALGSVYYFRGEFDRAEPLAREGLRIRRAAAPPPIEQLADSLSDLALVRNRQGFGEESIEIAREALSLRERIVERIDADSGAPTARRIEVHNARAQARNNLAGFIRRLDDPTPAQLEEARELFLAGLNERVEWLGENHPDVAKMHNNLARLLHDMGDCAAAEDHFRQSLRILRGGLGEAHPFIARAMHNLANTLLAEGALEEAQAMCLGSLNMRRQLQTAPAEIEESERLLAEIENRRP